MTESTLPHRNCSCSRHRQCAMHRDQMRAITRKPQEDHKRERQAQLLAEGLEKLKAKHGGIR